MSTEAKFYPKSNRSRQLALSAAYTQNNISLVADVLTTKTKARLNAIQPLHESKMTDLATKRATSIGLMAQKETMRLKTAMFCSHFLQVFNLCVKRGEYPEGNRAIYKLPAETDKLPALALEAQITTVAKNIITGEQMRVAEGGVPMSRPSAAEVEACYTLYHNLIIAASNAAQELDAAQEAVQALNKEVNGVIKKVWSEVETFYNEQTRESMREHARRWGVVYDRQGGPKKITGTVTHAVTGLPLGGVTIKLTNGRKKTTTNAAGQFTISTTLMHQQMLTGSLKTFATAEAEVTLYEDKNSVCNLQLVPVGN